MVRSPKVSIENSSEKKVGAINQVCAILDREFPDAKCALHHNSPEQLLFATILSAQCTDVRVNKVTPELFAKYPSSRELAKAKPQEVEKLIASVNFFRNKAQNLVKAAQMIQEVFHGDLPRSMDELISLPGVGRKTANVVLGDAFQIASGIVVDTHVRRLTQLLGWVEAKDPEKIEQELVLLVPRKHWTKVSHWLILHGRTTCIARRPRCHECLLVSHCGFGQKNIGFGLQQLDHLKRSIVKKGLLKKVSKKRKAKV